jgi:hypothetical protein
MIPYGSLHMEWFGRRRIFKSLKFSIHRQVTNYFSDDEIIVRKQANNTERFSLEDVFDRLSTLFCPSRTGAIFVGQRSLGVGRSVKLHPETLTLSVNETDSRNIKVNVKGFESSHSSRILSVS